jgi:hypothetical protein
MKENEFSLVTGFAEWFKVNLNVLTECFTPEVSPLFDGSLEDFALEVFLEIAAE